MKKILEHFSHRYTLAENGEVQFSLMERCESFCASVYICARNALFAPQFVIFVFLFFAVTIPQAMISQRSAPQAIANGKRTFHQSCAACHNTMDTTIKSGPGLKNYYRRQPRPADAAVRTIIQQGKGKMPAFSTLNRLQIDDLVAYLKTL